MRFYNLRTLSGKHGSVLKSVHNKVTAENVREGGDVACREGRRDGDEGAGKRRGGVDLWATKNKNLAVQGFGDNQLNKVTEVQPSGL